MHKPPCLRDGFYPFVDQMLPLSQLAMIEAPADLEKLLHEQAARNGTSIVRGEPVELRCDLEGATQATFLVYWPEDDVRLYMLAPREFAAKGHA